MMHPVNKMGLEEKGGFVLTTIVILLVIQVAGQTEKRTGNTCNTDTECPDNAWCRPGTSTRGYCVCKDGYIIQAYNSTHRECLKEAQNIGDLCTLDVQCQSKMLLPARCIDGTCRCKDGAHFDSGRCYDTAVVGDKCTVSQNCYIGDDGRPETQTFCVRGICTCTLLHSARDAGARCVKDAVLGEPCEDNEQCVAGGLRCEQNICRCVDDYVPHSMEPRCLPVTQQLGGNCEVETQCRRLGAVAICENRICSCAWGTREASGRCWNIRIPGEECTDSRECINEEGGNGTCVQGACATIYNLPSDTRSGTEHRHIEVMALSTAITLSLINLYIS